ncbi:MAG: hypothetical protein GXX82_10620 [Syntrophorhabdus sp.]|jgi:RHS repeat-associated protein|nr:hypothetical protein [Syntrophorhabdus sp.]HOD72452.1 RHS repeat-associated core domain-containing protein [Deltaproteobacteria bacterium]
MLGRYEENSRYRRGSGTPGPLPEHVYLSDMPLAMVQPTDTVYYYHTDHINTPRVMTNSAGTVAWQAAYHGFGHAEVDVSSTITNNLRFPGQYFDAETNLHYNWNRYYDPRTGRYLTPDPIGLEGGIDPYVYTENDPVNLVDREGLEVEIGLRKFHPIEVPYAFHCFVRFNRSNYDTSSFDNEGVHPDPNPGKAVFVRTTGPENDKCVRNEMRKCKKEDWSLIDFNCCHCVSNALYNCGLKPAGKGKWPNWPYGADNPPYQPRSKDKTR